MRLHQLQLMILFIICLCMDKVIAQSQYGFNTIYSLPTGAFAGIASHGFGVNFNTKFFLGPNVALGLTGGYIGYGEKKDRISYRTVPVTLDGEFYIREEGIRPYIAFSGGFVLFTRQQKFSQGSASESEFHLTVVPAIGVLLDLSRSVAINFNTKYLFYTVKGSSFSALSPAIGLYYKIGY